MGYEIIGGIVISDYMLLWDNLPLETKVFRMKHWLLKRKRHTGWGAQNSGRLVGGMRRSFAVLRPENSRLRFIAACTSITPLDFPWNLRSSGSTASRFRPSVRVAWPSSSSLGGRSSGSRVGRPDGITLVPPCAVERRRTGELVRLLRDDNGISIPRLSFDQLSLSKWAPNSCVKSASGHNCQKDFH